MITILLATYNSELYIREQLDSLLSQSYKDWRLVVRDDCSSDKTVDIIKGYIERYPEKVSLLDNNGISLRAYLSFVELLSSSDSDYYMFCDHDDVWLPNKIELSMKRMKEIERQGIPIIVHTDMKVVDNSLKTIYKSFWEYSRLLPEKTSFIEMAVCNSANGCTMLFNQKAKEVALQNVKYAKMHDILLNQSVAANGGIISPIYEPTVLYRQHANNVVGASKRDLFFYLGKIRNSKKVVIQNYNDWKLSKNILYYSFSDYLFVKTKMFFFKILKYGLI